eukprot:5597310-Amphidinium_carterae.1
MDMSPLVSRQTSDTRIGNRSWAEVSALDVPVPVVRFSSASYMNHCHALEILGLHVVRHLLHQVHLLQEEFNIFPEDIKVSSKSSVRILLDLNAKEEKEEIFHDDDDDDGSGVYDHRHVQVLGWCDMQEESPRHSERCVLLPLQ